MSWPRPRRGAGDIVCAGRTNAAGAIHLGDSAAIAGADHTRTVEARSIVSRTYLSVRSLQVIVNPIFPDYYCYDIYSYLKCVCFSLAPLGKLRPLNAGRSRLVDSSPASAA